MAVFRFEHRSEPMATHAVFLSRFTRNFLFALLMIAVALALGMVGYTLTEHLNATDSFLNAAMLLGGMGPVNEMHTEAGKIFAGLYALFCGLLIVIASGVILAPVLHRVLHAIHLECDDEA